MGDEQADETTEGNDWVARQDPYVERLKPDPAGHGERVTVLRGLLGDSDREGYKRLYFTRDLDHYAEFRSEEVVFTERIPAQEPPLVGLDATSLSIRRHAPIEYTWVRVPKPVDDFDLDIRLSEAAGLFGVHPLTFGTPIGGGEAMTATCVTKCHYDTCNPGTCQENQGNGTRYGATCQGHTCKGAATCQTCDQGTCQTCDTRCNQATCRATCITCATQCDVRCNLGNPTAPAHCIPNPTLHACVAITRNCA